MACPAVRSELALMQIEVAIGAGKVFFEKLVVHGRNVCAVSLVLAVAPKTVLLRFMEPYLGFEHGNIAEIMALQAFLILHAPPRDVAGITV